MYNYSYPGGANAGAVAGALGVYFGCIALIAIVFIALQVWLFWRILEKAGLSPWLALLSIIGGIGTLVLLFILALSEWPAMRKPGAYIPPTSYGTQQAPTYTQTPGYTPPAQPMVQPPAPPMGEPPAPPAPPAQ